MVAKQNNHNLYSNNRHLNTKNSRYSAVGSENFCLIVVRITIYALLLVRITLQRCWRDAKVATEGGYKVRHIDKATERR